MTRVSYSSHSEHEEDDFLLHRTIRRSAKPLSMLGNKKFKAKEERKRVLKMSVSKLKDIEDPENFLRRSVLINNTLKRLQSEVRMEKSGVKNIFYDRVILSEEKNNSSEESTEESTGKCSSSDEEDEEIIDVGPQEEEEESDSELLLKEVYMPPPISPVLDHEVLSRLEPPTILSDIPSVSSSSNGSSLMNTPNGGYLSDKALISCGQSSLFGELQSVVFNSLIASLET
eukprot:TRINITY_DN1042_c0_g1_i2.p1 TRINITY_DN1042_c0_g1~~TRINITY_DN1042_c0_g1_i2.p1  ORF type:complete len:229 (-),score=89.35 TRINITY_DN1042_c0_g1_i2:377-1063(-)